MRIYVAGPYSHGNTEANVRAAILAADALTMMGHTPYVPHLAHYWHKVAPHDHDFWMRQDIAWLELCEAVLRLPGESDGADDECAIAGARGMAVYESIGEVPSALG